MKYADNNHQFSISLSKQEFALPYRIRTKKSSREILDMTYTDHNLAVSGGWGYDHNELTVIECDTEAEGVATEYKYIEYRTKEELIVFREEGKRYFDIHIKHILQALLDIDGKMCDKLVFKVDAIPESELMMGEDHIIDQSKRIHYTSVVYFDITRFHGKR